MRGMVGQEWEAREQTRREQEKRMKKTEDIPLLEFLRQAVELMVVNPAAPTPTPFPQPPPPQWTAVHRGSSAPCGAADLVSIFTFALAIFSTPSSLVNSGDTEVHCWIVT
jgi:hypothetical protein